MAVLREIWLKLRFVVSKKAVATKRIVAAAPPIATEIPDKRPYFDVLWMVKTVTGPGETVLVSR